MARIPSIQPTTLLIAHEILDSLDSTRLDGQRKKRKLIARGPTKIRYFLSIYLPIYSFFHFLSPITEPGVKKRERRKTYPLFQVPQTDDINSRIGEDKKGYLQRSVRLPLLILSLQLASLKKKDNITSTLYTGT